MTEMIDIEVLILPQRIRKRGRIDPSAPLDRIKADMVKALELGAPDDYDISFKPKSGKVSPQTYRPSPGDLYTLIKLGELGGPAFVKDED